MRTLLIDDRRTFHATRIARNFNEAIDALSNDWPWDAVFLDFDLDGIGSDENTTGYSIMLWLETHKEFLPKSIACISGNPIGAAKIDEVIKRLYGKLFDNLYFAHETAIIDSGAKIGSGSKLWQWVHVMGRADIGAYANIGQNVFIGNVKIGIGAKIQNNVSIYDGVTLGDYVFMGPSCVVTNDSFPRSGIPLPSDQYSTINIKDNASIGANATLVSRPGKNLTIGEWAFVGAGSVVINDVPDSAVVVGNPARIVRYDYRR